MGVGALVVEFDAVGLGAAEGGLLAGEILGVEGVEVVEVALGDDEAAAGARPIAHDRQLAGLLDRGVGGLRLRHGLVSSRSNVAR